MANPDAPARPPAGRCRAPVRAFVVLVAATLTAAALIVPAAAQTATGPVAEADAHIAQLRQQADALSGHYFQAVGALAQLQQQVDEIEQRLPALAAEQSRLRTLTQERAVVAYERSGHDLGAIIGARDPLAAVRRARWLARLDQHDNAVADDLRATSARLADQRAQLRTSRDQAAAALDQVKQQGAEIDALLVSATVQRTQAIADATPTSTTTPPPTQAAGRDSATPTTTTTTAPPRPGPPSAPPGYTPTPGTSAHHDEPFLVCTRTHESSGNYTAYNPAGPYMGAYQYLQSTWNSAANHAGRPDLIGVPPSTASPYDQDEVTWSLYQWRGSAPWGGLCEDA